MNLKKLVRKILKRSPTRNVSLDVIALHEHNAYIVLMPKCACSSLIAVAVDILGFDLPEGAWKPGVFRSDKFDEVIDVEVRNAAKLKVTLMDALEGYWGFTVVRNPYDRLVSCFSEKIRPDGVSHLFKDGVSHVLQGYGTFRGGMSFPEFAEQILKIDNSNADQHFRSQSSMIVDEKGEIIVDKICRFESLDQDIQEVAEHLGLDFKVPQLNKSKRREWESYYTDDLREKVYKRYEQDFKMFGYEK